YAMRLRASAWLDLLEDSPSIARDGLFRSAAVVAALEARIPSDHAVTPREAAVVGTAPVDHLAFLAEQRMFRRAGVQTLADLASTTREVELGAGEVLARRGG